VLLCYITDRLQFPGNDGGRRRRLLAKIAEAARCGVDWIQLRERDLAARELERLAREVVAVVRDASSRTRLLINSRIDVALAAGADGVHLRSDDIAASEARVIWSQAGRRTSAGGIFVPPVIGVSCHTTDEVRLAEAHGADFALFAPVFEKHGSAGAGLEVLRAACRPQAAGDNVEGPGTSAMPVLALGGVTLKNARDCLQAGAAGIAAIRLFQDNDVTTVVQQLRIISG